MKNTPRQVGFGMLKRKGMDLSNTFAASAKIQSINHRVTKMKNKKIKPIFKSTTYNQNLISWIIEEFPENYIDLIYIDLFCDNIGVYLQKSKSKIEIINDSHEGIIQIYRAIKDEYKHFVKKINAEGRVQSENYNKYTTKISKWFTGTKPKTIEYLINIYHKMSTDVKLTEREQVDSLMYSVALDLIDRAKGREV